MDAVGTALHDRPPGLDLEVPRPRRRQLLAQQQLERRVRGLEGVAGGLQLLDLVDDRPWPSRRSGRSRARGPSARPTPARPCWTPASACRCRRRPGRCAGRGRVDLDGASVQARLVRERRQAPTYGCCEAGAMLVTSGTACAMRVISPSRLVAEAACPRLSCRFADDREQVGVAAALAVPVGAALDVGGAGLDGREGVGDRAARVVVAVDADADAAARDVVRRRRPARRAACRRWCRTARRRRRRPRRRCGRPPARTPGWRGSRRRSARRRGRPAGPPHAGGRPCRGSSRGSPPASCGGPARRAGRDSWRQGSRPARRTRAARPPAGRRRPSTPGPAGRAERGELRVLQVELGPGAPEELGVLGVGARPAALDEADAEVVEVPRDGQLVGARRG